MVYELNDSYKGEIIRRTGRVVKKDKEEHEAQSNIKTEADYAKKKEGKKKGARR